jgi:transcription initiation factor TFIIB
MYNNSDEQDHNCTNIKKQEILLITDSNTGEIMCSLCGQVLSDKISEISSDTTIHSNEDYLSKSRTGAKSTLAFDDMGLSTLIQKVDKDSTGKSLSVDNKRTFYRLRMWDRNSKAKSRNRNMQKAFMILEGLKAKLALSDVTVEQTAYIYRKVLAKKICRGRSIPIILSAVLYAACRFTNTPRTIQDISTAVNLKKSSVHKIYRLLVRELDLSVESYNPVSFISRIIAYIGASEKTKRDAIDILTRADAMMITAGKNPMAIAATVVYLSAIKNNENVTQTKIAKASNISSVTIRNLCRVIKSAKITNPQN